MCQVGTKWQKERGKIIADGIICKIWNIQSQTGSKSANAHLKDSLSYILDHEKTDTVLDMTGTVVSAPEAQLGRECRYIENDVKTLGGALIGTRNLISSDAKSAVREMMSVKEFFGKTDGRGALHGVISLPEIESDPENAAKLMQLCEHVMEEMFPDHQAVFAIHTNTENLHIHFIVNSVGLNGKKIHQDNDFIRKVLHPCINKYAKIYGFSPNEAWEKEQKKGSAYAEIKMKLRDNIDLAVEQSETFDEFVSTLKDYGLTVNVGKHISLKLDGMPKAVRTYQLGANYTKDAIVERIATKRDALAHTEIHSYASGIEHSEIFTPLSVKMKKYRDMSKDEREYALKRIKEGRNPWREQQAMNWQLDLASKQINRSIRVSKIVDFYSKDGTLQGALDGIIDAKKKISSEKKLISGQMRRYKPILDIYEEMKKCEKKAYLYEHEGEEQYRKEYEKYRELTRRLKTGYGKEITEVSDFVCACEERFAYARCQLRELSEEYREIKKYGTARGELFMQPARLAEMLDTRYLNMGKKQGVFGSEISYYVSETAGVMVRAVKLPQADSDGRLQEVMEVSVMTRYGEVLETFDSRMSAGHFRDKVRECERDYHFSVCRQFSEPSSAREFIRLHEQKREEHFSEKGGR